MRAREEDIAAGRLTIDLAALRANYRHLRGLAGAATCAAVIKADAYGLGIETVVPALRSEGCTTFFVARASEGVAVRDLAPSARIYVLDGVSDGTLSAMRVNGLMPVLGSTREVGLWREAGGREPCAIHVDTGMNRLGLRPDECAALVTEGGVAGLRVSLLMTHPACADEPSHPLNDEQRAIFEAVRATMPGVRASYCNSPALLSGTPPLDLVRPGIALYGGEAVNGMPPLAPVITLEARILRLRRLEPGESYGYGATWRAARRTTLAVCGVGYADGYPRAAGGGVALRESGMEGAEGAIGGVRVPVVGRISMDLTAFDVTDVPAGILAANDHIELIGPMVPLDGVARAAGTIGYELLTSLGRRYFRSSLDV